ncbi:hypothetical protein [Arsenicibacter rosenii]|uniref:Uncharacterized protein n=1 Tax=Arsenicibacter rosenii TaxID=1750698 RepID=A0A1S2VLW1_9BACT|nr:hypothetical protein [Arsenicibacter rosenii]OIN59743.1 hypothetical protein BLX24_07740 [Arsenicibacter rosenii]
MNYYARTIPTENDWKELFSIVEQGDLNTFKARKSVFTEKIHLGRACKGWRFLFNHNNWEYYHSADDFWAWLQSKRIVDEHERSVDYVEFLKIVLATKDGKNAWHYKQKYPQLYIYKDDAFFFEDVVFF